MMASVVSSPAMSRHSPFSRIDMTITMGLDIETTGFLGPDHRIVEVYLGIWKGEKLIWKYEQRIDPERSMPAEAQRVHGISSTDLIGQPKWADVAPTIHKAITKAELMVWHNGNDFDGPFLDQEFSRVGLSPICKTKTSLDTMLEGVWSTHNGKKPRLEELCFACGVPYDPALAHAAAYDVDRMMQAFFEGRKMGFFNLTNQEQAA